MTFGGLIPEMRPFAKALVDLASQYQLNPRVTSTRRSFSQQKRLYQRYLAGLSQFPAAPPGTSAHEYGYAMDMITTPMEALQDLGDVWLQWGGLWGENDVIHFEYPGFPHSQVGLKPGHPLLEAAIDLITPTKLTTAPRPRGYRDIAASIESLFQ